MGISYICLAAVMSLKYFVRIFHNIFYKQILIVVHFLDFPIAIFASSAFCLARFSRIPINRASALAILIAWNTLYRKDTRHVNELALETITSDLYFFSSSVTGRPFKISTGWEIGRTSPLSCVANFSCSA